MRDLVVVDVQLDGVKDVASVSYSGRVVWHESDGWSPPSFVSHVVVEDANGAVGIIAADLDQDGYVGYTCAHTTRDV